MKGIDISSHQGTVNFSAVKNFGIEIVYLKATEGLTYTDPNLKTYYNNAKAAGLKVGFYHFMRANDPIAEAKHFLSAINGLAADCKYCLDCETTENQSATQISARVRAFADYLIAQGKEVVLYTGESFYGSYMNSSVRNLPLWVAHYGVSAPGVSGWVGFQYSESGTVPGISSAKVDMDTFTSGILLNKTGWYKENNKWYCYENGVMVKSQWRKDSADWCYLTGDGSMATNAWYQDSSKKWFYVGDNGRIVHNKWQKDSKDWCYLGSDGAMVINQWQKDTTGQWCRVGADGRILRNTEFEGYKINTDGYAPDYKG